MMRICASLGSVDDTVSEDLRNADMIEIRTDIFDTVPAGLLVEGQEGIITFRGRIIRSMIPDGWTADIGTEERPDVKNKVISSYHDFERTPCADDIVPILERMDGDVVKGAFSVNEIKDVMTLLDVSRKIRRDHVIIGMNELGKITRIRQRTLGNGFTFAYVGEPTAPGQLSVKEMLELGDHPVITGIIGSGISYTRSPKMHDAAFSYSGIGGKYLVFDTPSLDRIDEFVLNYEIQGVNVTKPYKTDIVEFVDECDKVSGSVGAVNTVVNKNGKLKGYNTDVYGIEKALEMNSVDVKGMRALILGSGGVARSCAYLLSEKGCDATITGRNQETVRRIASEFSAEGRERTSVAVKGYDIIMNCTPLNKSNDVSEYPIRIDQIDRGQIIFDLVYGDTHLTDVAKERECVIVRGEDMLAHQGIRSFELFTSEKIPFDVMRDAV
ncbi:MAG: type I 3-dehydroquinate dehydratase [Methanomassiliicoccaceae archaeon]|nr:type I 3-dehydroquinate dehydratase [Methanomassiliicoccaceae archaeon]